MRRSPADSTNRSLAAFGKLQHIRREAFTAFLQQALTLLAAHSVEGSIHYVCMDWRHLPEVLAAGEAVFTELKNLVVWVKDNGGMGTFYRSRHELIFVFKHGTAPHCNTFELGQHGRYRTNVWQYRGVNTRRCCTNRHWPARCPPTGSSPADAV